VVLAGSASGAGPGHASSLRCHASAEAGRRTLSSAIETRPPGGHTRTTAPPVIADPHRVPRAGRWGFDAPHDGGRAV